MNVLTSYMAKEILKGSFLAIVFLLTLFNLFTFTDEMKDLGKGSYGLKEIGLYLALTSPRVFYELVPASALLGSLFILGAMANNRELIAMQAAGLSVPGIIRAVMTAGAILVIISIVVGEYVAPIAERKAQLIKSTAQHNLTPMHSLYGIWLRENNKFINVRKIEDNGDLADISIYTLNERNRLQSELHADRASFLGNKQWQLKQIRQSDISKEKMQAAAFSEQRLTSSIAPDILNITVVSPDNLSILELAKYVDFLKHNHQKSQVFELALWGRLINPFVTFVMLMISAPFVIGVRRGISVGARMILGVIIGLGFNILDKIVGHLGLIYELNAPFIALLPSLLTFIVAYLTLRRSYT
ncbi:LPS export ABC transporter permease LptG [Methylomicrobium sp. Wu6]|uniref:LPS export ABC transporter permease LptG n=1 Tax=Methylomicrobium sp. Wu6 TaxID=3107928 RepID=UPI002DD69B5E|nr:LPS export ABC transporter permease LptG [Methylomicrobium sp. Wu6]MEC4748681.1 LPS export ABC transporter permease LptG [Methylomicrobium sp. Wu6]